MSQDSLCCSERRQPYRGDRHRKVCLTRLYERYFSGDPWWLMISRDDNYPAKDELKNQVWEFIEGARVIDTCELRAKKEVPNSIVSVA